MMQAKSGDATVLKLTGRLDALTAPDVQEHLLQLIDQGERLIALDAADMDYIASIGLRTLILAAQRLRKEKGRLIIFSLTPQVREVFDTAGFSKYFEVADTRKGALAQLTARA